MKWITVGIALVAAGLIFGWCKSYESYVVDKALWAQRDSARADTIARLELRRDSLAKAYRIDTVHLRGWLTRWDTVKAGIDTIPVDRPVPYEVVRLVAVAADSAIMACREVLKTCEARIQAERERGDVLERRFIDFKGQQPSWFRRRASLSVGYAVVRTPDGIVHTGPAISFGLRLWPY